ncbi:MAG: class I SAM-dependent methyltransferase [Rhabdochlamydiaceae bacterium]
MQTASLNEIYSLSDKISCKEMWKRVENYEQVSLASKQELTKYTDSFTGKVKSEISIMRDKCPLCDSKDFRFLFIKDGFDHALCNSCDLIFTLQVLDHNKIKFLEVGKEGDNYGELKISSVINEQDRKKFEIVFRKIAQYTEIKNIFDFGSQIGTFLDWTQEKYSIVGHEYHDALREAGIKKGHVVLNDDLATIKLDREFDVITCWDYIDHVLNPHQVIQNLSKYLKKGGIFFYAINNRDCLSVKIMHKDSPVFVGPHHTMHYGINQLKLLMKDYELLDTESYVSELNWVSNWLNFQNPEFGDSALAYDLFDPQKICNLGMGIKLNAIFKKK